jgi:hypothetical protein
VEQMEATLHLVLLPPLVVDLAAKVLVVKMD